MREATLIYPHQLFENHPALLPGRPVYLVEDELFFRQLPFHKQKLVLHRASLLYYRDYLLRQGYEVHLIDSFSDAAGTRGLFRLLREAEVRRVVACDVVDFLLRKRMDREAAQQGMELRFLESPNFICNLQESREYFADKKGYFQTDFYIWMRKQNGILVSLGKPAGGKWTYDSENRKKLPRGTYIPEPRIPSETSYRSQATDYVHTHYPHNPGSLDPMPYAHTHEQARQVFRQFLQERFFGYGDYQDAIEKGKSWLFHSLISPSLNTGLLSPRQVLEETLAYADENKIPLNAVEGFIRQVLGWREYIRIVYELEGVKERTRNFFGYTKPLQESWWKGTTGIEPVDDVIRRVLKTGYCHHIERLMVLGNFMLLQETDPDEVYRWFMSLFIDAYDWVMVPNVYGMSQYADGGLMSTKPYISGSNYILKMSNFSKGPWCDTWDALYWNFVAAHQDRFRTNPRMSMMIRLLQGMPAVKRSLHQQQAAQFLTQRP